MGGGFFSDFVDCSKTALYSEVLERGYDKVLYLNNTKNRWRIH